MRITAIYPHPKTREKLAQHVHARRRAYEYRRTEANLARIAWEFSKKVNELMQAQAQREAQAKREA